MTSEVCLEMSDLLTDKIFFFYFIQAFMFEKIKKKYLYILCFKLHTTNSILHDFLYKNCNIGTDFSFLKLLDEQTNITSYNM